MAQTPANLARATQSLLLARVKVQATVNPPRPAAVTWQHAAQRTNPE